MKKRVLTCILLIALLCSMLAVPASASNGGQIAAQSRNGVVRIMAHNPDGSYSWGSAFGVGKVGEETTTFVTNSHVIFDEYMTSDGELVGLEALNVWIMLSSSAWDPYSQTVDTSACVPCEVLYVEKNGYPDIAVLRAIEPIPGRVALPLLDDESLLEAGDQVYALGYPGSSDYTEQHDFYGEKKVAGIEDVTITSGVVSRFTTATTWGNTRIIQHDAVINHGNSGGPLLNDKGVVVGLNTYIFGQDVQSGDRMNGATVRIKYITDVLDDLGVKWEPGPDAGMNLTILIAGIAAVVVIIVVVLIVVLKKRGKKKVAQPVAAPVAGPAVTTAVSAADTAPRLQCLSGAFAGQRFSIDGTVRIGRDPSRNDLVYPGDTQGISGVHCVITLDHGTVWLKDLGSTYGTFLANGQRLSASESVQLKIGDRFWLGSEREVFVIAPKGGI